MTGVAAIPLVDNLPQLRKGERPTFKRFPLCGWERFCHLRLSFPFIELMKRPSLGNQIIQFDLPLQKMNPYSWNHKILTVCVKALIMINRIQQTIKVRTFRPFRVSNLIIKASLEMEEEFYEEQALDEVVEATLPKTLSHRISEFEELQLKYTYSGISNASSSNDFMLTAAHSFNEEETEQQFVPSEQLFDTLSKTVQDLQVRMVLHGDLILYLLYLHRWNQEKLEEAYYDKHAQKYMLLDQKIRQQIENFSKAPGLCQVCLQGKFVCSAFLCDHLYCLDCWNDYIRARLASNRIFFGCMDTDCEASPVTLTFVEKISLPLRNLYRKKICADYSIGNKGISSCPSESCLYFCQKPITLQNNYVKCPCGVRYCFKCTSEPHEPATCEQVTKWEKVANQEQMNVSWIEENTRDCPQCKNSVERYIGCNHVKCTCGCEFCFTCSRRWDHLHIADPNHCSQKLKHSQSLSSSISSNSFEKPLNSLINKTISMSRSSNRDLELIKNVSEHIRSESMIFIRDSLEELSTLVGQAWMNLKWSSISLSLLSKNPIEVEFEKDTVRSIRSLVDCVDRNSARIEAANSEFNELLEIRQDLALKKESLAKALQVWSEAYKAQVFTSSV